MILEKGNMWDVCGDHEYFLITTNSYIRGDGALVMGRGIAAQAKSRWPHLPLAFGERIEHLGVYGLLFHEMALCDSDIGAFQVKKHYMRDAQTDIIRYSTNMLRLHAWAHLEARYDLNCPGIGYGRLDYSEVHEIIRVLPDNVHIWTLK